ncbi:MAG: glutamate 5-kinase, partial [Acidobacteria bacterium]|nr:glutamate 5-kinase [Acidobacteriota bacterium]
MHEAPMRVSEDGSREGLEPKPVPLFDTPGKAESARPEVAAARRIVVKLRSRVLTDEHGFLASSRVSALLATAAAIRQSGREVVLVSSGALALGCKVLGYEVPPNRPDLRRACAAVGQTQLTALYEHRLSLHGLVCAQVLVSESDFDDRGRNLKLRRTLDALLQRGVVPILNENDAVAAAALPSVDGTHRPVFGENDRMAALLAGALKADLLVLLTNVAGVYDKNPATVPEARLLTTIRDSKILTACAGGGSLVSRGGMRSKVEAALIVSSGGCHAVIASGIDAGAFSHLLAGEEVGTWFPARGDLDAMDRWIAYSTATRGVLHLDAGAVDALRRRNASLLAKGLVAVDGDFGPGDVVELRGPNKQLIGRG